MTIKDLKPAIVWNIFEQITKVPRPSKKEGKMREFLVNFAKKHNLEYKTDAIGNVAIFRPAAPGFENAPKVVLQGHQDMVCEKRKDVKHDFENDPIETIVEGEWLRANGTTLGADDGIGVAGALAALTDPDLHVGPLEGFFTVDEETGLTGASNVGEGMLSGEYLLNLDSEDDGVITMGCAGGIDTQATYTYKPEAAPEGFQFFKVDFSHLQGGHSGSDINAGRASATKLLVRLLWDIKAKFDLRVASIDAGNLRNAIAYEGHAVIGVPAKDKEALTVLVNTFAADVKNEYHVTEPDMQVKLSSADAPAKVLDKATSDALINSVYVTPHGVDSMSREIEGLVETSTNLASIKMKDDNKVVVTTSQRSAVESRKYDLAHRVEEAFKLGGATVTHTQGYQGWQPSLDNKILKTAVDAWERLYGVKPEVVAIHAGLECGLFLKVCPHMDMISFGPTLQGVHSPKERCHIPAVQKFWDFIVEILNTVAKEKK